jgi:hypothetical protein
MIDTTSDTQFAGYCANNARSNTDYILNKKYDIWNTTVSDIDHVHDTLNEINYHWVNSLDFIMSWMRTK